MISWSGIPDTTQVITISYAAQVKVAVPQFIQNTVVIENAIIEQSLVQQASSRMVSKLVCL